MDRASIKKNPPRYLSLADATKRFDPTRLDGPSFFQSIVSLQSNEDVYCVTRELENLESSYCREYVHVSVLDPDRSIRRSRPRSEMRSCSRKEIARCSTNVRPACDWYTVVGISCNCGCQIRCSTKDGKGWPSNFSYERCCV